MNAYCSLLPYRLVGIPVVLLQSFPDPPLLALICASPFGCAERPGQEAERPGQEIATPGLGRFFVDFVVKWTVREPVARFSHRDVLRFLAIVAVKVRWLTNYPLALFSQPFLALGCISSGLQRVSF